MKALSIDGGGIRGVFAVAILKKVEEELQTPIKELFDLFAGTSTGAIIAAAVTHKSNMSDVLTTYRRYGGKIFLKKSKLGLLRSIYSNKPLRRFLKEEFGETMMNEIDKPLLIPAVDLTHGKPHIYRSQDDGQSVQLWDAVLSSCSAPIYFPPNNISNTHLTADGGLWANNPSLLCLTEAIHRYQKSMDDIKILSIGTGQQNITFTIEDHNRLWGLRKWFPIRLAPFTITPKLLDLALNLSSETLSYHCQLLLGNQYLRVNEELGKEIPFDRTKEMDWLIDLAEDVYKQKAADIIQFIREK